MIYNIKDEVMISNWKSPADLNNFTFLVITNYNLLSDQQVSWYLKLDIVRFYNHFDQKHSKILVKELL